jgi:hypothetical protein
MVVDEYTRFEEGRLVEIASSSVTENVIFVKIEVLLDVTKVESDESEKNPRIRPYLNISLA